MSSGDQNRGGVADKALQLVLEMKRNPDVLPPYNVKLYPIFCFKFEFFSDRTCTPMLSENRWVVSKECCRRVSDTFRKRTDSFVTSWFKIIFFSEKIRAGLPHDSTLLQPRLAAMCHIRVSREGRFLKYCSGSIFQRCMMAYVNERKNRIRSFRWKYGGALPASVRVIGAHD